MNLRVTTELKFLAKRLNQNEFKFLRLLGLSILFLCVLVISNRALAIEILGPVDIDEPLDGPGFRAVGWQWHYIDQDGKPGYMEKVSSDVDKSGNELASYTRTDGCQWTRMVRGFAPAGQWSKCPSTGSSTVTFEEGDIWPLKVGNSLCTECVAIVVCLPVLGRQNAVAR